MTSVRGARSLFTPLRESPVINRVEIVVPHQRCWPGLSKENRLVAAQTASHPTTRTRSDCTSTHVDVLIIGAGVSGIGAAHHLRENFPERSFTILESQVFGAPG